MKKFSHSACQRINAREIRPFMQIAVDACESEVVSIIGTAVFAWADVLNVKGGQR